MQIDFHHGATYVVARLAGFAHTQASTIAHAAQYVDDSSETGYITFDNEMRYYRQATAHPITDPENLDDIADAQSWLPFHFLPGGQQSSASAPYREKLVCRPNSPVAQDMVAAAIADRDQPWALHRMGIAAHVLIDTWAHQGFVGLNDDINEADGFQYGNGTTLPTIPLPLLPPVGHGQARSYPDMPYLVWSYKDHSGHRIQRNNPQDFQEALKTLLTVFQTWLGAPVTPMAVSDQTAIETLITGTTDDKGADRHAAWLAAIAGGAFSFGAQPGVSYDADQWKDDALGGSYERRLMLRVGAKLPWSPQFLTSDWKLFHDAAKCQRHDVMLRILPKHGILEG